MQLNGNIIVTPLDNPGQFDPDWRNLIAMGLMDSGGRFSDIDPAYARYGFDPWIRKQVAYLSALRKGAPLTGEQSRYRLASLWFQGNSPSDLRFRLEPLLLTAVSYRVIALDILGDAEDMATIEAYEKVYFNIRDKEGRLSRSCQLRQYFALPSGQFTQDTPPEQMWKMIGSLFGYDTLVSIWMWKDAHGIVNNSQEYLLDEMWRLAQSRLFMSMFADRVGHESMAKLLAAISAQQKLIQDGKNQGSGDTEMIKAMQGILGLMSPVVVGNIGADVDRAKIEAASTARLQAESAVAAVDIGEIGQNGVKLIAEG